MKLRLTLNRAGQHDAGDDILVVADATATVGALAAAIARRDPRKRPEVAPDARLTLRIDGADRRVVPGGLPLDQSGIRSGQAISVVPESPKFADLAEAGEAAAVLEVVSGADAGKEFRLRPGANILGRDRGSEVRLSDHLVSKRHARITVGETVEIVDLGSSNGILLRDEPVQRTTLRAEDVVVVGDTAVRVVRRGGAAPVMSDGSVVGFNRCPRLQVHYAGVTVTAPEPPRPQTKPRFAFVPVLAPLVIGAIMFALTKSLFSVLFVALSPMLMIGNVVEGRIVGRRAYADALAAFRQSLGTLATELSSAAAEEVATRGVEHPSTESVLYDAQRRAPLLWARRPDAPGFLDLRLGLGRLPSRSTIELPARRDVPAESWRDLVAVRERFAEVDEVPVVAALTECGALGVAGPRAAALGGVRSAVVQLTGLHSPAEVILCAVAGPATAVDWDWLKWLPHVMSDHSPLSVDPLAMTSASGTRLVAALEELVDVRREASTTAEPRVLPRVVLLVEDDAPVERSRLVELAEYGPRHGLHVIWVATSVERLPAACRTYLVVDDGSAAVGFVTPGARVTVRPDRVDKQTVESYARSLASVVDIGAKVDDGSDLPQSVSLLSLLGADATRSTAAVVDRWRTGGSLPGEKRGERRRRQDGHLRAAVGIAVTGQNFVIDLRENGPHALVGGTTGSGKSEFLQSWIAGLAVEHSPARVTFLFVDYKGGAAFSECERLPHSVGMVTDLTPHLVGRVLGSLRAELRHREGILREHGAKSLVELERRDDVIPPPSLVIVVDEFAALATEVPEFVDGVVDIAQRGRSLGLHLILATQRPAGVIKDNLRANTNLRIALRMADEHESVDVIGTPQAAYFDALVPGRAVAKVGAGRVTAFQSGYVGGWTSDTPALPALHIADLRFGSPTTWEPHEEVVDVPAKGPNDLHRLVDVVVEAHHGAGLPRPRRPWLDPLPPVVPLRDVGPFVGDDELLFGMADLPGEQRQVPVSFRPDDDGNMAVYGTGGSGKSAFLRTLAISAALSGQNGPCHVYALDFGGRGLQVLEGLPHVGAVVNGDDHERLTRLLRWLRQQVDERARRFAAADAGSIRAYRQQSGRRHEPRILLLVDSIAAFRKAYETGERARWFDVFQSIVTEGRQVGVHVVVSADRSAAVPTAISSLIQRRLVLRLAGENEYAMLGVSPQGLGPKSPPGRGFLDGVEVQVAVLGEAADTQTQATEVRKLRERMLSVGTGTTPVPVQRLPERVPLGELPVSVGGLPALGVADESLEPVGFTPEGTFLVAGPGGSGRTSLLATLVLSLRRWRDGTRLVYLGGVRSPLPSLLDWFDAATNPDDIALLAATLTKRLVSGDRELAGLAVVVENLPDLLNSAADLPLQELVKAGRHGNVLVIADGDTSGVNSSWPLLQPWKAGRHGVILQPDQNDGEVVFKTPFPRMSRGEFPAGRGVYVRAARALRVQCALPDAGLP